MTNPPNPDSKSPRMRTVEGMARALGISEERLPGLRKEYGGEENLRKWLLKTAKDTHDRVRLLPKNVGDYTESRFAAMPGAGDSDPGEAPDPAEIASYRSSRDAAGRFQAEQIEQVEAVLERCQGMRASIKLLDVPGTGREARAVLGRIDALERKLLRRIAA